ncbi:HD-GYP domain-containing protein [Cellvibrio sp. ARAG 10.3]|uniref:HD-GYP domain-containing protein n=1 Tax=Cellvibrio sp. ARAG 10.3 TaxID=3451358 RepID=UPI003F475F99
MLKRIAVQDLRLGMYIHELCGSWMEHPFWRSRFLLTQQNDLKTLLASGIREVWIDTAKGADVTQGATARTDEDVAEETEYLLREADKSLSTSTTSMADEVRQAMKLCNTAKQSVVDMFSTARMGKAIEVGQALTLVEDIANSASRHPHALISLARLKNVDEYTYMHSVAVCGLMIALARQLNMNEERVREAGLAGLLHDIGKIAITNQILNKPGKLTDTEFAVMKTHPERGLRILQSSDSVSPAVLDVCLHHHEKIDGTGYPHGLRGDDISLLARMGAVSDVYDAITSDRPYKQGWLPAEAIRKMAEWSKGHFDDAVFQAFVKTVGIYPIGSLVRLTSGRLGVVIEQNADSLLTPRIKVFFSTKSRVQIAPEVVDLARQQDEKIVGRESAETWGFRNLEHLWIDQ